MKLRPRGVGTVVRVSVWQIPASVSPITSAPPSVFRSSPARSAGCASRWTYRTVSDRVRVLIVDDEPLARRGVRLHLEAAGGFEIVGESANGREAIADIMRLRPQVVFLDVQMPGVDGFGVVEAI